MNTADMNGKQIKAVYWPDTESDKGIHLIANDDVLIDMSATHHGDHDEFWICEHRKTGKDWVEVARHNLRCVESFRWA